MVPGMKQGLHECFFNEWLNGLVEVASTLEEESGNTLGCIFPGLPVIKPFHTQFPHLRNIPSNVVPLQRCCDN